MSEAVAVKKKRKKQNQTVEILKRLAKNKLAMVGVITILLMLIISILAPVIAPYDPAVNFLYEPVWLLSVPELCGFLLFFLPCCTSY